MKLSKLIENLSESNELKYVTKGNPEINGVCYDSRKVTPGDIFVAIKGISFDGNDFIDEAIDRGAVGIITQNNPRMIVEGIHYVKVNDTRKCLAEIACTINGNPSKSMIMIGITGTNGKTTTSYIVEQIIRKSGYYPGIIGTINSHSWSLGNNYPSTTPESLELQYIIRKMLKSKTHVVLEVSSHALDLKRVHGCYFDIAVFTNLTQDHFDYHNSLENYWNAKQKLFTKHLKKSGTAIINIDDHRGKILAKNLLRNNKVITTGYTRECNVRVDSVRYSHEGTRGRIKTPIGSFNFSSSLIGKFNLSNTLNAVGVGIALGANLNDISDGINTNIIVPGRLEPINNSKGVFVYVDYAHTPDALEKVIKALKCITIGKLITIFGCGGNKDISKREVMGKISGTISNLSIVTSDNPRSEKLGTIIEQIVEGIKQTRAEYIDPSVLLKTKWTGKKYTIIFDRREAILTGINAANYGDTVVIAGKGHETYQIIGQKTLKFNDKEEVIKHFTSRNGL